MKTAINRRSMLQQITAMAVVAGLEPTRFLQAQTNQTQAQPVYVSAEEGAKGKIGQMDIQFKLSSEQSSGTAGLAEITIAPGALGALPHYHDHFDELCRVLEGTVHILTGNTVTKVSAGGWHLRPRGMVHTFWNSGDVPAKTIDICLPGGHEKYLKELAALFDKNNRPSSADFKMLEKKHDIHYRPDLLPGIMKEYKVHL
ncbi:MAG: cupin domain-containing protein [Sediminibacterium sp.]|nr:MAG: Cupin 2 barrel domain-containing [Chitinophagaceae bacterium]MDP1843700.1 cupin domain-containing protein [Sediminibacterium sp.]TXT32973.1 MAG: Cupin 2 barrel domain-containing protein [Chitinophagaceae bacterium]